MDFLVDGNNVKWNDDGATGCYCQSTSKGAYIFNWDGRPLYRLSGSFPHTINGEDATTYQEFQDLWMAAGGSLPPNYSDVVQYEGLIYEDTDGVWKREDLKGDRDGIKYDGIVATGISQLNFSDLSGLTILKFYGTSTYTIVGNSIILDPLLKFSSILLSNNTLFSVESINGSLIIGSQMCAIVGSPVITDSDDYPSWRNMLGYNEVNLTYAVDDNGAFPVDDNGAFPIL